MRVAIPPLRYGAHDFMAYGRTITQAVSRPVSTRRTEFDARLDHIGFVVDKVALG
jgi:hypothetical protein